MSLFYSTNDSNASFSLAEAIFSGLAPDGGLFMLKKVDKLPESFFVQLPGMSFAEIALKVSYELLQGTVSKAELADIIDNAFSFNAPLVALNANLYALELFHGPTLSFKDFGANFMAQLLSHLNKSYEQKLHILAATSGDTGSAVAHGFHNVDGIHVWILYPQGQVSDIQEKQLTTMGGNVTALEVAGSFDDCQALVKRAFNDADLRAAMRISSANSISIARLLPQTFYYFSAFAQLPTLMREKVIVAVPSGNFGNLTAGLLAKRMGLPIDKFIAAKNNHDSVPRYMQSGIFNPRPSLHTLSNAMDVGNPSNFARIIDLYRNDLTILRKDLDACCFTDDETKMAMREMNEEYGYVADPHGAVAYLGIKKYMSQHINAAGIFLETAHPAKFLQSVEEILHKKIPIPKRLTNIMHLQKNAISIANDYDALKNLMQAKRV